MDSTLRFYDGQSHISASEEEPYPVRVKQRSSDPPIRQVAQLHYIYPIPVPGITLADAFDAADVFGSTFVIDVPVAGEIVNSIYYDLDDEGATMTLHLFYEEPGAIPASDAAFALSDADLLKYAGRLVFDAFQDNVNGQIGICGEFPFAYYAPEGKLWCVFSTAGTPTIAAANIPRVSFTIKEYAS